MTPSRTRNNIWLARPGGLLRKRCRRAFLRQPVKNAVSLACGEDTTYQNDRTGLHGELETARQLRRLSAANGGKGNWFIAHSVTAGDYEIDHLVVSDRGVFVLNTKATRSGRETLVTPQAVRLHWKGKGEDALPQMRAQVRQVQDTITRLLQRPSPTAPVGVVVTVGFEVTDQGQPDGVHVLDSGDLVDWLLGQPRRLKPSQRDRLVQALTPPSAWEAPARAQATGARLSSPRR